MALSSTILIGELQKYFNEFIISSSVNKNSIKHPTTILDVYFLNKNSFIRLLFDDSWDEDTYEYEFLENDSVISWPQPIKNRMMIYPSSAKYYELVSTPGSGENFFQIQQHDLTLLDSLLSYRNGNDVSINTDSTGVVTFDSTSFVLTTNIDSLDTNLSKLIYTYLRLEIDENYTDYDNTSLISDSDKTLEMAYETYVIDKLFDYVSSQGTT